MQDIRQNIIERIAEDIPLTEIYAGFGETVGKIEFYRIVSELIEIGAITNIMICWCGIDCTRCRTFRATLNNDDEMRKVIQKYYEEIGSTIEIKDLYCLGCRSDEIMLACSGCPYMKCGKEKGLKRCDECSEYPCESLQWYTEKYIKPSIGKLIEPVMKIKILSYSDIPAWILLSKEYDCYVQEIALDLTEWYDGNETSLSFDKYMNSKISKNEAFMATDETGACCGITAISKTNNNITFFAISHKNDFYRTGELLLDYALSILDTKTTIKTNIIKSNAEQVQKQHTLFSKYGFIFSRDDLENGVPVICYEKPNIYQRNNGCRENCDQ